MARPTTSNQQPATSMYEVCFYRDGRFLQCCDAKNRVAADLLALEADRQRLDAIIYCRGKAVRR